VNATTSGAKFSPASRCGEASQRNAIKERGASKAQGDAPKSCFEYNGYGHFARDLRSGSNHYIAGVENIETGGSL